MLNDADRDEFYTHCARAINEAGHARESLLLARAVLLLAEEVSDLDRCKIAVDSALKDLVGRLALSKSLY
jgi:hypothetical protein